MINAGSKEAELIFFFLSAGYKTMLNIITALVMRAGSLGRQANYSTEQVTKWHRQYIQNNNRNIFCFVRLSPEFFFALAASIFSPAIPLC